MVSLFIESALRSLVLATLVWLGLRAARVRSPRIELLAWTIVLATSLLMPVLMGIVTLPAPLARVMPSAPGEPILSGGTAAAGDQGFSVIYGLVALALIARWATGLLLTHTLLRDAAPVILSTGAVRVSAALRAPVSFGTTIYLPTDYATWPEAKLRAVLAHERSHLARGDFFLLAAAMLHRALFWFSPLAWWLPARLSALTEIISDGEAVAAVGDSPAIARILLDFAEQHQPMREAIPMARANTVAARIARLLKGPAENMPMSRKAVLAVIVAIVPVIVLAAIQLDRPQLTSSAGPLPPKTSELQTGNPEAGIVPPKQSPASPQDQPAYPAASRRLGEEGAVILLLAVDEKGVVTDAQIDTPSGHDLLDAAAVNMKWNPFIPGTVNGKPTAMRMKFAVRFKIAKKES